MPRNLTGGNKSKKGANKKTGSNGLRIAEKDHSYAKVTDLLGDGRFNVELVYDGSKRIAKIKGALRNREWVKKEALVLISGRDCDSGFANNCDIIHKYSDEDARVLDKMGELKTIVENKADDDIFTADVEEDECIKKNTNVPDIWEI
jgi:translation initiation factor 1A